MIAPETTASARDLSPRKRRLYLARPHRRISARSGRGFGLHVPRRRRTGATRPNGQCWTTPPRDGGATPEIPGVVVHRLADCWSRQGLRRLDRELDAFPPRRRFLVQHAPLAWGRRGMNLDFCRWTARRGRAGDEIDVMFHEVAYTILPGDSPAHWAFTMIHRLMARTLIKRSRRVLVSIPGWEPMLRRVGLSKRCGGWLPIPSTIAVTADPRVAEWKARSALRGETIVGHFGTFGDQWRSGWNRHCRRSWKVEPIASACSWARRPSLRR